MSPAPRTTSSAGRPSRARRAAFLALAAAASLCLTACSVVLNPGIEPMPEQVAEPMPEPGVAPGVVGVAVPIERASEQPDRQPSEQPRPTAVEPIRGRHTEELGTVDVQPAPSGGASRGADREPTPGTGGEAGAGDGGSGGGDSGDSGSGGGTGDGTGEGSGGGSGDGAAQPDLTDAVQYAGALEDAVNGHRTANGLPALVHDACAYDVALERARDLIGQELAHAPLDPIFQACPTMAVAENLAKGGWSPAEAAQGWMDSEGHRANILNGDLTRGAIACVPDGGDPAAPVMICAHVFLA